MGDDIFEKIEDEIFKTEGVYVPMVDTSQAEELEETSVQDDVSLEGESSSAIEPAEEVSSDYEMSIDISDPDFWKVEEVIPIDVEDEDVLEEGSDSKVFDLTADDEKELDEMYARVDESFEEGSEDIGGVEVEGGAEGEIYDREGSEEEAEASIEDIDRMLEEGSEEEEGVEPESEAAIDESAEEEIDISGDLDSDLGDLGLEEEDSSKELEIDLDELGDIDVEEEAPSEGEESYIEEEGEASLEAMADEDTEDSGDISIPSDEELEDLDRDEVSQDFQEGEESEESEEFAVLEDESMESDEGSLEEVGDETLEDYESLGEEDDEWAEGEITLSSDELDNIIKDSEPLEAGEIEEPSDEKIEEETEEGDIEEVDLFRDEEEQPLEIGADESLDELSLEGEEGKEDRVLEEVSEEKIGEVGEDLEGIPKEDFGGEEDISGEDLFEDEEEIEFSDEDISELIEDLDEKEEAEEKGIGEDGKKELDIEALRKVLKYLDDLLGNLPDEVVEKFAQSEYFDLYEKILKDLGVETEGI